MSNWRNSITRLIKTKNKHELLLREILHIQRLIQPNVHMWIHETFIYLLGKSPWNKCDLKIDGWGLDLVSRRSHEANRLNPGPADPQSRESGCLTPSSRARPRPRAHPRTRRRSWRPPPQPCGSTAPGRPRAPWQGRPSSTSPSWAERTDSSRWMHDGSAALQPPLRARTNLRQKSTEACTPLAYCKGAGGARVCALHCRVSWTSRATLGARNSIRNRRIPDWEDSARTFPWSFPRALLREAFLQLPKNNGKVIVDLLMRRHVICKLCCSAPPMPRESRRRRVSPQNILVVTPWAVSKWQLFSVRLFFGGGGGRAWTIKLIVEWS